MPEINVFVDIHAESATSAGDNQTRVRSLSEFLQHWTTWSPACSLLRRVRLFEKFNIDCLTSVLSVLPDSIILPDETKGDRVGFDRAVESHCMVQLSSSG